MKAILEFNLPDEDGEHKIAIRGGEFYCAILAIERVIREHYKYDKKIEDAFKEIEQIVSEAKTDDIP
jgi:hypothetical protein